jgi:hypothetical protein
MHIGCWISAGDNVTYQNGALLKVISDQISFHMCFLLVFDPFTLLDT